MNVLKIIFWGSFAIIFYSYLGYGILLFCLVWLKRLFGSRKNLPHLSHYPHLALIIPAYNEETFIEAKIRNTLQLQYPANKLSVIFVTDGSTDKTTEIVRGAGNFQVLHKPERKGKSAAMNRAVATTSAEVLVFCDANTLLNPDCLVNIARHYADPRVGGVAGEKKILSAGSTSASSAGEGIYWKYESLLKKLDSAFYSVVGAAGELFSLRAHLYKPIHEQTIIEDFVLSLKVCMQGYVVRYEPAAYAIEQASDTMWAEQKRKIRIAAGAFQAMGMLAGLFNIFRYGKLSFQFISHRVLRWTICPLCLLNIFAVNLLLVATSGEVLYFVIVIVQFIFYLLAISGWILASRNIRAKVFFIPYYFLFMNLSVFIGFKRFLENKQSVLWDKARTS